MTFRLTAFDGVAILPTGMPETPVGTVGTAEALVALPGGAFFDAGETTQGPELPHELPFRGFLLTDDDGTFTAKLDSLKARRGKLGVLKRWDEEAGMEQWCEARLLHVDAPRTPRNQQHQAVTLKLKQESLWRGTYHGDLIDLDAVTLFPIASFGTAPQPAVVITVTCAATPITKLEFAVTSESAFKWEGAAGAPLAAGESLEIDCGKMTVKRYLGGYTDAYAEFDIVSGHAQFDWLTCGPVGSDKTLEITKTGGGAGDQVQLTWYELYE